MMTMMKNCFFGILKQRKTFTPCFHIGPFSDILIIAVLRHTPSMVSACPESEFSTLLSEVVQ